MSIANEATQLVAATDPKPLDQDWLRAIALEAGADDVGFVSVDRDEIATEREHIFKALPEARTLISIVTRLNVDSLRSPQRSIGNLEFHRNYHHVNEVAAAIVCELARHK
ncbi:MAG: hypothetical protein FJX16_05730, partial [Alphaproteobacteria bacterium]|nr:hypothetical protein [Alphaproteobacteria bacterium]